MTVISRRPEVHPNSIIPATKKERNVPFTKKKSRMSPLDMIRSPRKALRENWTLVKFMLVGLSGVLVNLALLTIFINVLGKSQYLVANAIAVEASIISNFFWNDKFTFNRGRKFAGNARLVRLGKYNLVSLVSFSVNQIVFFFFATYTFINHVGLWYIYSSLAAIVVAFAVNYFGSSKWAWKHHFLDSPTEASPTQQQQEVSTASRTSPSDAK